MINRVTPCPPKAPFSIHHAHSLSSPTLSIFFIHRYLHTQLIFLFQSIVLFVLKIELRQFVTPYIFSISDFFTTGTRCQHLHSFFPSTLPFVSSRTVQYLTHKNKIYTDTTIIGDWSHVFPYLVGSFRTWDTHRARHAAYSLQ